MKLLLPGLLLAAAAAADQVAASSPDRPAMQPRNTDRDGAPVADMRLTDDIKLGGRFDIKSEIETNHNLDSGTDEREFVILPELSFSISYEPFEDFELFSNFVLVREYALQAPDSNGGPLRLQLEELYAMFDDLFEIVDGDVSIQIGRQRIDDPREWLFDDRLDGVRVFWERNDFTLDFSATRRNHHDLLNSGNPQRTDNYMIYGYREIEDETFDLWGSKHEIDELLIGGYALVRNDRAADGEDLTFLGVHAYSEIGRFEHWLDLAHLRGRSKSAGNNISGYGFDIGTTYTFDAPWQPAVTLGYAFGSGDDDPHDGTDGNFRQTGLQDNQDRLAGGVVPFRYYGTLLEPELSNLGIRTAAISVKPKEDFSIHLLYHDYRQHRAFDELRDTNLDADPNGESRRLGKEVDLVFGFDLRRVALELEVGYFIPGRAFDDDEDDATFFLEIDFQVKF